MTIKAIQTRYKGYHFRSRGEARFAILLDGMGIAWDYEPEGFELPSGWYLPDFFVYYPGSSPQYQRHPGAGYWVEIKGAPPTSREERLCLELAAETGHKTWIFHGGLGSQGRAKEITTSGEAPSGASALLDLGHRITREHEAGEIKLSAPVSCCYSADDDFTERFYAALGSARSARFEHGETPNV